MDFRVVAEGEWKKVAEALNGVGVESVQGKWEEMFVVKEEEEEEEVVEVVEKKETSKKGKKKKK